MTSGISSGSSEASIQLLFPKLLPELALLLASDASSVVSDSGGQTGSSEQNFLQHNTMPDLSHYLLG
jgi:hypothetical protein